MPLYLIVKIILHAVIRILSLVIKDLETSLSTSLTDIADKPDIYFNENEIKKLVKKGILRLFFLGLTMMAIAFPVLLYLEKGSWHQLSFFDFFNSWIVMPLWILACIIFLIGFIFLFASLVSGNKRKKKLAGIFFMSMSVILPLLLELIWPNYSISKSIDGWLPAPLLIVYLISSCGGLIFFFISCYFGTTNMQRRKTAWLIIGCGTVFFILKFLVPLESESPLILKYVFWNMPLFVLAMLFIIVGGIMLYFTFIKTFQGIERVDFIKDTSASPNVLFGQMIKARLLMRKDIHKILDIKTAAYEKQKETIQIASEQEEEKWNVLYDGNLYETPEGILNSDEKKWLHARWQNFVNGFDTGIFNRGLTKSEINKIPKKFPAQLYEIYSLSNGQNESMKGVFHAKSGVSKVSYPKYLKFEQIHPFIKTLNQIKYLDVFDSTFIPFATDSLTSPDDVYCYDTATRKIMLLWVSAPDYFSPPDWQFNKFEVAESLERFIIDQSLLKGIDIRKNLPIAKVDSTINPGPKVKPLKQKIGNSKHCISLPKGYSIQENPGPDFITYYFLPETANQSESISAGIYLGTHPNKFDTSKSKTKVETRYSKVLGHYVDWEIYSNENDILSAQTVMSIGSFQFLHLFGSVNSPNDLPELFFLFSTLELNFTEQVIVNGKIILYELEMPGIKTDVKAYFNEKNDLVIDGCDMGKSVEEQFGDSDYEYQMTISLENVDTLYKLLNISPEKNELLLREIAKRFQTGACFSDLKKYFDKNEIKYEYFSY